MCFLAWRHTVIYHYPGDECDQDIDPDNENQYIVWGVGGLGDTAFRHFVRAESEFGETSLQIQYFTAFRHFIQTSSETAYWPLYGIKPLLKKLANKNFMVDELLANFVTQKRRQGRLLRSLKNPSNAMFYPVLLRHFRLCFIVHSRKCGSTTPGSTAVQELSCSGVPQVQALRDSDSGGSLWRHLCGSHRSIWQPERIHGHHWWV